MAHRGILHLNGAAPFGRARRTNYGFEKKQRELSRKFFEHMRKEHPEAAYQLLFNLGRVLSERLATAGLQQS